MTLSGQIIIIYVRLHNKDFPLVDAEYEILNGRGLECHD